MVSRLSQEDIQQLAPLLGSLARLVIQGSQLSENELRVLILGIDVVYTLSVFQELQLWERLLRTLKEQPLPEMRSVTVEALVLRGLPEATVLLSVDAVTKNGAQAEAYNTKTPCLMVHPPNLNFGTLTTSITHAQEIEIQGGPGHIVVESSQVIVPPTQFGSGTTRICVSIKPIHGILLWTALKLITRTETVEVPVLAQWSSNPANLPPPIQALSSIQPSHVTPEIRYKRKLLQ